MDAANRLIKTAGLLFVIALLLAAPGWAQTPVLNVPPTVSLSGTGGQNVNVTSTPPSTPITFTIGAPQYAADNNGVAFGSWLVVNGGTTTPTTLSFGPGNFSGLQQGTHTATVTLTPNATTGAVPVTTTVTYTSNNPGGGGNGNLTAFPSPVNVSAASGSQFQTSVNISTTSITALTLTVAPATLSGGNWLTANITGPTSVVSGATTSLLVTCNAFNLSSGLYTGTITVTPSSGSPLAIPVNFTVGGNTGGNGSWTVSPNSVPFSFNTNSGIFPTTPVTVTTTTGATNYSASATSSNGWLPFNGSPSIGGLSIGQPYALTVGSQANILAAGSYSGTVTITDPSGATQGTIQVTLNVNGGNSSGLTLSPNPLNLTSALNGVQQNSSVTVSSTTGGTLSITGNLQSWINFQYPANTLVTANSSVAFTVNANPTGLAAGLYSQVLNVTVGSQSSTLTVNLTVGGSGTGTGTTAVAPTSLNFAYQSGTAQSAIAQQKIVITGPAGSWSSVITTVNNGTWLQLSTTGGSSLPDPANSPVVYVVPAGLAVGNYSGTVAITTGGGTQNVTVALTVAAGPVLVPTPGSLVFVAQTGAFTPGQSVFFSATDSTVGPLNITVTSNNTWISVNSPSASSMSVTVNPAGMAAGVYSGSISIIQNNVANTPYSYPVVMVVNGGGSVGGGPLTLVPSSLAFSAVNGSIPSPVTLTVSAAVSTPFTYSTSVSGGVGNWITISPASGSATTTSNFSVGVNPSGLLAGSYSGAITFVSNNVTQTVPVALTVGNSGGTGGGLSVSPSTLNFSGLASAGAITQALTINSAPGSANVSFTVTPSTTSGGNWLSTTPGGQLTTSVTISATANPAGLTAGLTYFGNLAIQPTSGNTVNVPVTLTVTAPPTVSAAPAPLSFTYRVGDTTPAAQSIAVSGSAASLPFSAIAVSSGNWLGVSPNTGTTPGTVSVTISPSGLSPATYMGTVTIAGTGVATGSTTVIVTLLVTAPLPTITKVTNAASYAQGTISPGEIITLFAADPTHPIGPATAAFLAIDPLTGKVSTKIGGTQVLVNGVLCPMVFSSAAQVSAVVPYEVASFSSVTIFVNFLGQTSNGVLVNVATTAPGLFTSNSSGIGPGAILNSNNSVNGPGNGATTPATRGDTVVVYLTGEGQTSPAGVTGKVTTVSATPPLTPGPLLPVSVTIGGQPANWSFAGEAPTFVSGVMQLNVQIPANSGTGEQEILVTIGANQSQRGVTVSVSVK